MVNAVYQGIAVRHQPGEDQARRCTQVRCHDGRTGQLFDPGTDRRVAFQADFRPHALHF